MIEFDCEGCGVHVHLFAADDVPASGFCGGCHELNRCWHESVRRGFRWMSTAQFLAIYDRMCRQPE